MSERVGLKNPLRITLWHHKAYQVMRNSDPEGWIFLSHPYTNSDFFSCSPLIPYFMFLKKGSRTSLDMLRCDITWHDMMTCQMYVTQKSAQFDFYYVYKLYISGFQLDWNLLRTYCSSSPNIVLTFGIFLGHFLTLIFTTINGYCSLPFSNWNQGSFCYHFGW